MRRTVTALVVMVMAVVTLPACLYLPGETSQIALVSTASTGGWKYDFYRNSAYPCAISGFQTFVVATRVGSSNTATAPLWVYMHGGGIGWFDSTGTPRPDSTSMSEESATSLRNGLTA